MEDEVEAGSTIPHAARLHRVSASADGREAEVVVVEGFAYRIRCSASDKMMPPAADATPSCVSLNARATKPEKFGREQCEG